MEVFTRGKSAVEQLRKYLNYHLFCCSKLMIFYLVTQKHAYTMRSFLNFWGNELASRIKVLSYEYLIHASAIKPGTYIFSDIERLIPEHSEILSIIWEKITSKYEGVRLLNHPVHSMRRYELLRTLYECNYNKYNIYRLTDSQMPKRFPVFLRGENDHLGSLTPLLQTPEDLAVAIDGVSRGRQDNGNKVIIEFCDTSDANGIFRKYSAYVVGERIIPQHIMFGRDWMLKGVESLADKESELLEEQNYLKNNPHERQIGEILQLTGINYGRIDYSILNGRPQVWEINSNPTLMSLAANSPKRRDVRVQFVQQITSAFETVDFEADKKILIPVSVRAKISDLKNTTGLKSVIHIIIVFLLDRYYYIRQTTLPRAIRVMKLYWLRGKRDDF